MNLSVKKFIRISARKERSISLAAALWAWFTLLTAAAVTLTFGGLYAMYVFTHVDESVEHLVVDPPETVTYRGAVVSGALERYRERKEYFTLQASKVKVAPLDVVESSQVATSTQPAAEVASTTDREVE